MTFSNSLIQNIQGNAAKYFSYREAWTRIIKSQEQGFYLEAVTIEESIITDRLISYLVGIQAIERSENLQKYPNFARLINIWREKQPEPINIKINDQELNNIRTLAKIFCGIIRSFTFLSIEHEILASY